MQQEVLISNVLMVKRPTWVSIVGALCKMSVKGGILMSIKEDWSLKCLIRIQLLDTTRYKLHQIHCGGGERLTVEAVTEPDWRCGGECGLSSSSSSSTDGEGSRSQVMTRVRRALAAWKSSVRPTRVLPENI